MSSIENITAKVDAVAVKRLLKCEKENEEIEILIKQEIENCKKIFSPRAEIEIVGIDCVSDDNVFLKNGVVFEGNISKQLAECTYAAVSVCTLGKEIDGYIKKVFESGDYLRAITADTVAFAALRNVDSQLRQLLLKKARERGLKITARLSPGDSGWELSEQKKIFECFHGNIGVTLNASCMMSPLKSMTAVYGLGKGIAQSCACSCDECTIKDCAYKMDKVSVTVKTGAKKAEIYAFAGQNLYELLKAHSLIDSAPCAGMGICGKCKVKLSNPDEPSAEDIQRLTPAEIKNGIRLACRVSVYDNMEVCVLTPSGEFSILTGGGERKAKINPPVIKKHVTNENPQSGDYSSLLKRVCCLAGIDGICADIESLRALTEAANEKDFSVTAYNGRLIDIEKGDTEPKCFGMAVDIGTTTVVCCLVSLKSGRTVDIEAGPNVQRACGADVISRIEYTISHKNGTQELRDMIVGQINSMTQRLCKRNSVNIRNIYNTAICGNTTMIHFLLGLPSRTIAAAPFMPVTTGAIDIDAGDVGLATNGVVSVMPGISGYVGADITAGILECGITESEKFSLLLDLGTNGEMALGNKKRLLTCSAAAGPAFEGGNIQYGVSAVRGAIYRVNFKNPKLYWTIGSAQPVGICGSGLLDAISGLVKCGIVDETGRMAERCENPFLSQRLVKKDGILQFVLEKEPFISVTQKDVREFQLAKAAVRAGIEILMKEAGVDCGDIDKVYIAGGFGNYLDIESAAAVGLIPEKLKDKTVCAGNSAEAGTRFYLLSKGCRRKALRIAQTAEYIELSNRADFSDDFMNSMNF
jgi:uncharacterized 2Fe-2S/4Fe-4S cluster protein (DUF4445 family)